MSGRSLLSASITCSATVAIALLAFVSSAFPARADMVTDWNVIALDTIPATISGPPHARLMGYVQAAVFDAVNSVERKYAPYAVDQREPRASPEVAAAVAAHGMLVRFYPAQKATLDAKLTASLVPIPDGEAKTAGTDLGRTVADQLYNLSLKDGADAKAAAYTPGTNPWSWQYTEANMEPRGLTWGGIKPFMLKSPDQFAFIGPHEVTSTEYAKDLEEVRLVGGVNSTQRTADQTAALPPHQISWCAGSLCDWRDPPCLGRLAGGWDCNRGDRDRGGPRRTTAAAEQEAARSAGSAGGHGLGRARRQSDGVGRCLAARCRAARHALPRDQPPARQGSHRHRRGDSPVRPRGAGARRRRRPHPGVDHRPEPDQHRAPDGDGLPARGRAGAAVGLAGEENKRRHRLCRAARGAGQGCGAAARGGEAGADGRSLLRLARPDRVGPGAGLGLAAAAQAGPAGV